MLACTNIARWAEADLHQCPYIVVIIPDLDDIDVTLGTVHFDFKSTVKHGLFIQYYSENTYSIGSQSILL